MPGSSELIDFRRAFWWLLGGVLLPSVGLVAFGVVAVANERAAVEARLAAEYGAKLRTLDGALRARLQQAVAGMVVQLAAASPTRPIYHPLLGAVHPLEGTVDPELAELAAREAAIPETQPPIVSLERAGTRFTYALVRPGPGPKPPLLALELNLQVLAGDAQRIAAEALPLKERAIFRMIALPDKSTPLDTLRRLLSEVAAGTRSATVARLPLSAPLDGYLLTAELQGDDPAAAEALRNRTLYIALLALLYTSIGVGFGLTLRELFRAARLSRLKTDFVANISHELRTPLTSVRLFAETLQSGRASSPEEVRECLDLLAKEAERLSVLVEKLLDWSRLESGKRVLARERTEVSALLEQVAGIFRAQQLGVTYQTELEPGLPAIAVDRDAMAQVVLNLLHNAVKYTGEEKRILLRARRLGKKVALEVEDNGAGVRPHERKRIFERFYRADDLLSRRTEGTGLGLAIAKRIVEWHGGSIEVHAREGGGSTFRVLLAAEPASGEATRTPGAESARPAAQPAPAERKA